MSEYTYADVIIDPKDERVKIGEQYYTGGTPTEVLNHANDEYKTLKLAYLDYGDDFPFIVEENYFF